jgi:undecaprenyl-diphosphatase
MSILEAFILGIIQGLTEFLPVSSSGHIELGKAVLGVAVKEDISFTVVVHGATVLSTIVVLYREIAQIFTGLFQFKWNDATKYAAKIVISMLPVVFIGLLFKDQIESFFTNNVMLVGIMLILTAALLAFTYYAKNSNKEIGYAHSFIIGISQAVAVLPGISRSGATIATALLLGVKKEDATKFSFLMVLVPIIGANAKDMMDGGIAESAIGAMPLIVGFIAAFVSGMVACKLMINIVKKGKLIWFAAYCLVVGIIAITAAWV